MNRPLLVLASLLLAAVARPVTAQDPAQKIDLRVLYTGAPESRRTKEFTEFLGNTFTRVESVELAALDAKAAAPFDVVIVDSPSPYPDPSGKPGKMPQSTELTIDFTKPAILMGAAGGSVLNKLRIKLNWL